MVNVNYFCILLFLFFFVSYTKVRFYSGPVFHFGIAREITLFLFLYLLFFYYPDGGLIYFINCEKAREGNLKKKIHLLNFT